MKHNIAWVIVVFVLAGLTLSACAPSMAAAPEANAEQQPATIEHLEGANPTRETLTEEAAKRLDIQTAAVTTGQLDGASMTVVPYAAILYDTQGATWVYTSPEQLVYVRQPVTVKDIQGDQAFLSAGPAANAAVVTVGAEELYGAEFEFQEE